MDATLPPPRKAVLASIPLAILMVIYTGISLSVIAEPMVKFDTQSIGKRR